MKFYELGIPFGAVVSITFALFMLGDLPNILSSIYFSFWLLGITLQGVCFYRYKIEKWKPSSLTEKLEEKKHG